MFGSNYMTKKYKKFLKDSHNTATKSKEIIESRGHKVSKINIFPIVVSDEIESVTKTKNMIKVLDSLNLLQDVRRLDKRKPRTGKSSLRGRGTKIGKSVLFVVAKSEKLSKACKGIPGIDVKYNVS